MTAVKPDSCTLSSDLGWSLGVLSRLYMKAAGAIMVRAGNSGAVSLTIDGVAMGAMGKPGEVITWRIQLAR